MVITLGDALRELMERLRAERTKDAQKRGQDERNGLGWYSLSSEQENATVGA